MSASERMLSILPRYYDRSKVMQNLQKAIGAELDRLQVRMTQIEREFSPSTAEETIGDWEKEYGLTATLAPINLRRAAVIAAMRSKKTTTKDALRMLAEATLGVRCDVTESADGLQVIVSYFGEAADDAIRRFITQAEKIMPAHVELLTAQKPREPEYIYVAAASLIEKRLYGKCRVEAAHDATSACGEAVLGEMILGA